MQTKSFDTKRAASFIAEAFDKEVLPALSDYIRIPNLSRDFDPEFLSNGLLDKAADFLLQWANNAGIKGLTAEKVVIENQPPLLFIEVAGTDPSLGTILFYGHYDKQPPFLPWREGLGPTTPVLEDGKLYGRGGADDGYALFGSLLAIKTCQEQGSSHPRCVLFIEGDEESGSPSLEDYFFKMLKRIGSPRLVVCLDSGASDYDTLWITDSLRGLMLGKLNVEVLSEGVHSGDASGIVPSSFRIARQLLDRIENIETGYVNERFQVNIPPEKYKGTYAAAEVLGKAIPEAFPFVAGAKPTTEDVFQMQINRTWRPQLSVTGADGLPPTATAGNVLRPKTTLKLSIRTPPTLETQTALKELTSILTSNPPYNAHVSFVDTHANPGWSAPALNLELENAINEASVAFYGRRPIFIGDGGSIPFVDFFGRQFPGSQFLVTGVLGPNSNAHGPNEFLHVDYTKRLVSCIAYVIAANALPPVKGENITQ
eukprot:TRINITY_DN5704_c0_g1_i1.p1 TRINITY_DN5704_c0_g1~~TRINITY_DN5704_c0_g1_i1.p1  ORF type:complete len:484 (+),score=120.17 TRINITY_DN5704_c0_g1_i1:1396-2847(+)